MPLRLTMPMSVMNPTQCATDSVVAATQTCGHCHHGTAYRHHGPDGNDRGPDGNDCGTYAVKSSSGTIR